jgi:hypothetical protein
VKPYNKKAFIKIQLVGAVQGEGPEFKLQYHEKKKKEN